MINPDKLREHRHRHLIIWIFGCLLASIIFLGIYVVAQQSTRQTANIPQIEIARGLAGLLNDGKSVQAFLLGDKVDIAQSDDIFIMIYDNTGTVASSSGLIDGAMPTIPIGVLKYARDNGENRVTWQPRSDVRIATVISPFNNGYVVVGRSLRNTEVYIKIVGEIILWAWVVVILLISLVTILFALFSAKCYIVPTVPIK